MIPPHRTPPIVFSVETRHYFGPKRLYNLDHNILELYNVLVQVRFTTSKTKRDIQYSKLRIRVASQFAERRVRILGNKKILGKFQICLET